jgi:hypothetical protein
MTYCIAEQWWHGPLTLWFVIKSSYSAPRYIFSSTNFSITTDFSPFFRPFYIPVPYDSVVDSKQKMHLFKNHQKTSNFIIKTLKNVPVPGISYIFCIKYALKCHENAFLIVGIVEETIFKAGFETGSVTFISQRGSGSESVSRTRTKMGSGSGKKSFGSTTLPYEVPVPV